MDVFLSGNHGKDQKSTGLAVVICHQSQKILIATLGAQKFLMTYIYSLSVVTT